MSTYYPKNNRIVLHFKDKLCAIVYTILFVCIAVLLLLSNAITSTFLLLRAAKFEWNQILIMLKYQCFDSIKLAKQLFKMSVHLLVVVRF